VVGDRAFAEIQAGDDRRRQYVEKQCIGFVFFDAKLLQDNLLSVAQPFLLETCVDARAQQNGVERFRQIVLRTRLDAAHGAFYFVESGNHQHG
jgi:hypothetical protein